MILLKEEVKFSKAVESPSNNEPFEILLNAQSCFLHLYLSILNLWHQIELGALSDLILNRREWFFVCIKANMLLCIYEFLFNLLQRSMLEVLDDSLVNHFKNVIVERGVCSNLRLILTVSVKSMALWWIRWLWLWPELLYLLQLLIILNKHASVWSKVIKCSEGMYLLCRLIIHLRLLYLCLLTLLLDLFELHSCLLYHIISLLIVLNKSRALQTSLIKWVIEKAVISNPINYLLYWVVWIDGLIQYLWASQSWIWMIWYRWCSIIYALPELILWYFRSLWSILDQLCYVLHILYVVRGLRWLATRSSFILAGVQK